MTTNILVVDDSAVDRRLVGGLLEKRADFRVTYAEDGLDALRKMETWRPDVVVTDINMPHKNGLELVRAMRIHFGGVPVILITALGSEELAVQALEHGAASYVPKVTLHQTLIDTIDDVLALTRAKRSYERLVGSIQRTEFDFTLDNDPDLFDPFVELFQQMVHGIGLCDDTDRYRVGMAIKEALANALYRGNLEISYEQTRGSGDGLMSGTELDIVRERLAQGAFAQRRINIRVHIDRTQAVFVIRDDGPGFDTAKLPAKGDLVALDAEGGRGIVLMNAFMDEVTYNAQGNEVTLVKRRR
ncbi:MAG: response regulator [Pirellulaceae bacterium]|jgi:CheY-like chemotaxis protein|nr:response regulator [Pirellulaceae bacterium]